MKKPNITEGEWIWHDYIDKVEALQSDNITVCELNYCGADEDERQATAKAISAVPEMIDALIESHKDLVEWNDCIPSSNETEDIIEQIEQALKKAGVEL